MKSKILLLALTVAAFSSCTTAYKTGQTPDDVYFSPARAQEEYVRAEKEDDRRYVSDEYYDDRYLRMKVSSFSRYRWNDLNDWYSYERYGSGYNYSYGSYYNPYNSWNYYYNPYCNGTVITSYKNNVAYNRPRTFNLNAYNGTYTGNKNFSMRYSGTNTSSRYNSNGTYTAPRTTSGSTRSTNNNNGNTGRVLRDIFSGGNNNNNSNSSSNNGKTNSSSSSSSSSSGSSSSGGSSTPAPVRKF